ncbi:hypothetical protein L9W92_04470 [Pelotomaculum terephthalicicum JT]|uniref:hypothetical protein n=1 Tax=Pelotomaculum TaxID=191373 RepID=UPI0009D55705|nr:MULTISPECIES: hypothetical protein [Pelotomaculum]MCG9967310.1 hypothetical protein [Pelotomaculum terephthalicicum JT]OPX89392.1 MAG: hypothetical protein A4E54_00966 [Pelotomaculum sp. PtaB.Bin117]OPY61795.1 MAG: hypothetical protein A4E56_01807 [Pelotomaculum sp. PtaU1.Bin065]
MQKYKDELIEIPKGLIAEYNQLCLFTKIQVFGEEELSHWQCSLTLPKKIMVFKKENNNADKVSFQYVLGDKPGFKYSIRTFTGSLSTNTSHLG